MSEELVMEVRDLGAYVLILHLLPGFNEKNQDSDYMSRRNPGGDVRVLAELDVELHDPGDSGGSKAATKAGLGADSTFFDLLQSGLDIFSDA